MIIPFYHSFRFVLSHPLNRKQKALAISTLLKWQINTILNPNPVVYPFTERCKLLVRKGMTGATGNIYCGLHEFEDMAFLLHFLRPEDLFADIGANVGSYTILASGHVGAHAVSAEPIPGTFETLQTNIRINDLSEKVRALNAGIGSKKGVLHFTRSLDTVNHVAMPGEEDTLEVEVRTIDDICSARKPQLIKIDVEGFESEVIAGGKTTLQSPALHAIIIELNGSGGRYGFNEADIHSYLLSIGFASYRYHPFQRKLVPLETFGKHNTLYLRDPSFVEKRIKEAEMVKIKGISF